MKITITQSIFNAFNIFFMIILMVVTLYPLIYVLFASLSEPALYMAHRGILLRPLGFNLQSYRLVFQDKQIISGFYNTIFVLVTKVSLAMTLTIVGAYFLSRRNAMFVPLFTMMIVFTMFFNGGLIPNYLNVKSFHIDNTLWALIFPTAINTFNLIILRTAFAGIPYSLDESAMIDGAGPCTTLFKILLPLVKPTVMVCLLYYSVEVWNSWFDAMIYLRKKELFPLQLVLREILINNNTNAMNAGTDAEGISETVQYAVMMVATIPILLVYPFLQKHFVKGVMIGAVKG